MGVQIVQKDGSENVRSHCFTRMTTNGRQGMQSEPGRAANLCSSFSEVEMFVHAILVVFELVARGP